MLRIGLGIIVAFFAWAIVWFGAESFLSAAWPAFGEHQAAFQSAIENGSEFTAIPTFLIVHIFLAAVVSLIAGFLAALVAGENKRAPLILGLLLSAMGLLKAAMSWTPPENRERKESVRPGRLSSTRPAIHLRSKFAFPILSL